ncbi:MAG: hypothetical protein Q8Q09_18995 [Deltaproteobacteria bacterium]|nr:hypothetical protein [Deltaproteobacteria bacterium]
MNEEPMVEYPAHIEALMSDAREMFEPPAGAQEAVRLRLAKTLGPAMISQAAVPAATQGLSALWATLAALTVGVVIAWVALRRPAPTAHPATSPVASAQVSVPAPAVLSRPVVTPVVVPVVSPVQAIVPVNSQANTVATVAPRPLDTLAAEQAILDRARASVRRSEWDTALSALQLHARRFARGQLVAEREAMRVRALMASGRREEGQRVARSFVSRFAAHPLRSAVEAMAQ